MKIFIIILSLFSISQESGQIEWMPIGTKWYYGAKQAEWLTEPEVLY